MENYGKREFKTTHPKPLLYEKSEAGYLLARVVQLVTLATSPSRLLLLSVPFTQNSET